MRSCVMLRAMNSAAGMPLPATSPDADEEFVGLDEEGVEKIPADVLGGRP